MGKLHVHITQILATSPEALNLKQLSEITDKMNDNHQKQSVSSMQSTASSGKHDRLT